MGALALQKIYPPGFAGTGRATASDSRRASARASTPRRLSPAASALLRLLRRSPGPLDPAAPGALPHFELAAVAGSVPAPAPPTAVSDSAFRHRSFALLLPLRSLRRAPRLPLPQRWPPSPPTALQSLWPLVANRASSSADVNSLLVPLLWQLPLPLETACRLYPLQMSGRALSSLPPEATSPALERKAAAEAPSHPIQAALSVSRIPFSACPARPFRSGPAHRRPHPPAPFFRRVGLGAGLPHLLCPLRP